MSNISSSATTASKSVTSMTHQATSPPQAILSLSARARALAAYILGEGALPDLPTEWRPFIVALVAGIGGALTTGWLFSLRHNRRRLELAMFHVIRILQERPHYAAMIQERNLTQLIREVEIEVQKMVHEHELLTRDESVEVINALKRKARDRKLPLAPNTPNAHQDYRPAKRQRVDFGEKSEELVEAPTEEEVPPEDEVPTEAEALTEDEVTTQEELSTEEEIFDEAEFDALLGPGEETPPTEVEDFDLDVNTLRAPAPSMQPPPPSINAPATITRSQEPLQASTQEQRRTSPVSPERIPSTTGEFITYGFRYEDWSSDSSSSEEHSPTKQLPADRYASKLPNGKPTSPGNQHPSSTKTAMKRSNRFPRTPPTAIATKTNNLASGTKLSPIEEGNEPAVVPVVKTTVRNMQPTVEDASSSEDKYTSNVSLDDDLELDDIEVVPVLTEEDLQFLSMERPSPIDASDWDDPIMVYSPDSDEDQAEEALVVTVSPRRSLTPSPPSRTPSYAPKRAATLGRPPVVTPTPAPARSPGNISSTRNTQSAAVSSLAPFRLLPRATHASAHSYSAPSAPGPVRNSTRSPTPARSPNASRDSACAQSRSSSAARGSAVASRSPAPTNSPSPLKKKCGRPRKSAPPDPTSPSPAKKRGRPRKSATPATPAAPRRERVGGTPARKSARKTRFTEKFGK